ncbi:Hypothetical protein SRAE_1000077800 [Strongyloides ratti]|uniref:Uncharacterized protein n=1 Tax=Strongyloides ratti TaxID=34506 RepID=A0A090MUX8_STRRB|nr:Hypothetical protein SRAE_1000077800 [Strongyloides ratti]CEF62508.1 Hypothetical protein SRAE_1000077800 [Strongyloides ratti]
MTDELKEMKSLILENQKTIILLTEKIKKLEEKLFLSDKSITRGDKKKPLTAAEIVGHNMDIMNLIIERITNIKDRKNIELTCKTYYLLCNRPDSYIPIMGYEAINSPVSKWQEKGGFTLFICNQEIEIDIPKSFFFNEINSQTIKTVLEKYVPKMKTLYIMKLFSHHIDFFKKLKCFKSIEIVKFSRYALQTGGADLFEKCTTLKPHTFIANNDHMSTYNLRSFSINKKSIIFPKSLKNIYYDCFSEDLVWLLLSVKNCEIGKFDSLIITKEIIDYLQYDEIKLAFLKFLTYFKCVNYFAGDFLATELDNDFGRILAEHNIAVNLNIYFERYDCEYRRNAFNKRNSRLLAHPGFYHNIKSLTIFDWTYSRLYMPFTEYEIKTLSEDLSNMVTLTTLEIDFSLFCSYPDFYQIFSVFKNNLKNLKIYRCGKMEYIHLSTISQYCIHLNNLSLINIKNTVISIKEIITLFKYLKGLEVEFQNNNIIFNSACETLTLNNLKEGNKFMWPDLKFLHIICNLKNFVEKDAFEKMEKETSRKAGTFFLRNFYRMSELFVEVIIQKDQLYYDNFKRLFTKR